MRLLDNSKIALRYMMKKPLRTFLVLQGMIWAVAVAIFPNSLERGSISNALSDPATHYLDTITFNTYGVSESRITEEDAEGLRKEFLDEVEDVTLIRLVNGQISRGEQEYAAQFVGTDSHSPDTRTFHPGSGRYISAEDVKSGNPVCVLERSIAHVLFGDEDPVGKKVTAYFGSRDIELEVIGVMEKRNDVRMNTNELGFRYREKKRTVKQLMSMLGLDGDAPEWKRTGKCIHVPYSVLPGKDFDWMIVKTDPLNAADIAETLQAFLVERGRQVKAYMNIVFPVIHDKRLRIKHRLTKAVFGICLLLGGVMIMNVMLLSVMERYREIAIRRVEGAGKLDIIAQFMTEGAVLCIVATILGVPVGMFMAWIAAQAEVSSIAQVGIPYREVWICGSWAVAIGLISALIPASKAASIDPAEILRQN